MKLSAALPPERFPVLREVVKKEIPNIARNVRIMALLAKYGETRHRNHRHIVAQALSPANPPWVTVNDMGDCANYWHETTEITLNVRLAAAVEVSNGKSTLLRSMLIPLLLHEMVHHLHALTQGHYRAPASLPTALRHKMARNTTKSSTDGKYDYGSRFEIEAFGAPVCVKNFRDWQVEADKILKAKYPEHYKDDAGGQGMPISLIKFYRGLGQ